MFDFAWSEFALIGVVALVFIGPKDMPVAIRAVSGVIKKARKMAAEFQTHVDEMVKDTELNEVRKHISDIRNFDFKGTIERAIDEDGSIRKTFADDPFKTATTYTPPAPVAAATSATDALVAEAPVDAAVTAASVTAEPLIEAASGIAAAPVASVEPEAPAFIPPSIARPPVPPAFIPPGTRASAV